MEVRALGERFVIRLLRGEKVIESLTRFASDHGYFAGSLVGIGALEGVELGYYELGTRTYHRKVFEDDYELVNLTGNLSKLEEKPFVHAHVTLGDKDYRAYAGHLFEATVAVTVELVFTPLPGVVDRVYEDQVGLNLWCLEGAQAAGEA